MSQTRKLPALLHSPSMVEPRTSRPPMVCCHLHMPKSYEEGTVRLSGLSFDGSADGILAHCSCGLRFAGSASEAQRRGARFQPFVPRAGSGDHHSLGVV